MLTQGERKIYDSIAPSVAMRFDSLKVSGCVFTLNVLPIADTHPLIQELFERL